MVSEHPNYIVTIVHNLENGQQRLIALSLQLEDCQMEVNRGHVGIE